METTNVTTISGGISWIISVALGFSFLIAPFKLFVQPVSATVKIAQVNGAELA